MCNLLDEALERIPETYLDVMEFGFETGLRPSESTALQAGDIDLINRQALIRRSWSRNKLRETTKAKNKRWIPLSDRAFEIIAWNIKDKLPGVFVFLNPKTGRHFSTESIRKTWRNYSGSEVDYYSASRHSFCTQVVETGVNALQAQELMRHSDIRTTQKYFHASVNKLRNAVNIRGRS